MKNSQLKDEFEKVNESSGTSPHRYGKEAFKKSKKSKKITMHFGLEVQLQHYWFGNIAKLIIPIKVYYP